MSTQLRHENSGELVLPVCERTDDSPVIATRLPSHKQSGYQLSPLSASGEIEYNHFNTYHPTFCPTYESPFQLAIPSSTFAPFNSAIHYSHYQPNVPQVQSNGGLLPYPVGSPVSHWGCNWGSMSYSPVSEARLRSFEPKCASPEEVFGVSALSDHGDSHSPMTGVIPTQTISSSAPSHFDSAAPSCCPSPPSLRASFASSLLDPPPPQGNPHQMLDDIAGDTSEGDESPDDASATDAEDSVIQPSIAKKNSKSAKSKTAAKTGLDDSEQVRKRAIAACEACKRRKVKCKPSVQGKTCDRCFRMQLSCIVLLNERSKRLAQAAAVPSEVHQSPAISAKPLDGGTESTLCTFGSPAPLTPLQMKKKAPRATEGSQPSRVDATVKAVHDHARPSARPNPQRPSGDKRKKAAKSRTRCASHEMDSQPSAIIGLGIHLAPAQSTIENSMISHSPHYGFAGQSQPFLGAQAAVQGYWPSIDAQSMPSLLPPYTYVDAQSLTHNMLGLTDSGASTAKPYAVTATVAGSGNGNRALPIGVGLEIDIMPSPREPATAGAGLAYCHSDTSSYYGSMPWTPVLTPGSEGSSLSLIAHSAHTLTPPMETISGSHMGDWDVSHVHRRAASFSGTCDNQHTLIGRHAANAKLPALSSGQYPTPVTPSATLV